MQQVKIKKGLAIGLLAVGATTQSVSAHAEESDLALAKAKLCMACHQVDEHRVGPSFRVIAERYGDSPGALAYLVQSIRNGGRGRWGAITMPKQPQVSEGDARQLSQWILTLTPQKPATPETPPQP